MTPHNPALQALPVGAQYLRAAGPYPVGASMPNILVPPEWLDDTEALLCSFCRCVVRWRVTSTRHKPVSVFWGPDTHWEIPRYAPD